MKALSIKQPWASLIASGLKDIENRTWKTSYRGRIYIHASGQYDKRHRAMDHLFTYDQWNSLSTEDQYLLSSESWIKSAIIGEVDIVDCICNSKSVWAEKQTDPIDNIYHWVLENAVIYDTPILNVKGKLSLWEFDNTKL